MQLFSVLLLLLLLLLQLKLEWSTHRVWLP
jgi:hypothetical protein